MALNDPQIRGPLRKWLRGLDDPELLADELPVREGRARIDLASILDHIHAVEIKGQTDRLKRLVNQTNIFGKVCHRCTVVTTSNHLKKIYDHIPDWWGVVLVERNSGHPRAIDGLLFTWQREGGTNPGLDHRSLALMLWKDEMLGIFEHYGHMLSEKTPKSILAHKLKELIPSIADLLEEVLPQIVSRAEDDEWAESHLKEGIPR